MVLGPQVESLPEDGPFVIKNAVVDRAITRDQHISWKIREHMINAGSDPHKGLKYLMSVDDKLKNICYIHKYRNDWGSLSTSWCWGNQAAVCGASNRNYLYADLNLSRGLGPKPDSHVLMVVLWRGGIHKDQHTMDNQVGVLRYKHYLLCAAFNTVLLHIINDLCTDNIINFLHPNKKQRAS
jgi:hypothetical protein